MDIRIRKAEQGDTEAIVLLTRELGYTSTKKEVEKKLQIILENPEQGVFVAETEEIIGWMYIALIQALEGKPFVEIRGIVVKEIHRGKGAGTKMIQTAEKWTRETGIDRLRIRTNITREGTREYYRNMGFISLKKQEVFEKEI